MSTPQRVNQRGPAGFTRWDSSHPAQGKDLVFVESLTLSVVQLSKGFQTNLSVILVSQKVKNPSSILHSEHSDSTSISSARLNEPWNLKKSGDIIRIF